jgi:hypothetical protein
VSSYGGRPLGRLRRVSRLGGLVTRRRPAAGGAGFAAGADEVAPRDVSGSGGGAPGHVTGPVGDAPGSPARTGGGGSAAASVAPTPSPALSWDLGPGAGPRRRSGPDDDTAELPFRGVDLALLAAAPAQDIAAPRVVPPAATAPDPPGTASPGTPHVWRLDPMAEQGPDLLSKVSERRREIVALVGLTAGATFLSFLGLILGFGLVAISRFWDLRDKLLAMLVLPASTAFGGIVLAWLRATRIHPPPDPGLRLDRAIDGIAMTVLAMPLLVGWLGAAYLGYLLIRDANHS